MYTLKINILLYGSNSNTVINFLVNCINLSINEVVSLDDFKYLWNVKE